MHLCVLDATGAVAFDNNLPCRPDAFLAAIAPFCADLIVGVDDFSNGEQTVLFLHALVAWRAGKKGRLVLIWDNAPCHVAKVVTAEAARLGIEVVKLPGYSPDLNPIERLWDWMREEVTRGHCHSSLPALRAACQWFITQINGDPEGVIDRLWPKFDLDPEHEAKLLVST